MLSPASRSLRVSKGSLLHESPALQRMETPQQALPRLGSAQTLTAFPGPTGFRPAVLHSYLIPSRWV